MPQRKFCREALFPSNKTHTHTHTCSMPGRRVSWKRREARSSAVWRKWWGSPLLNWQLNMGFVVFLEARNGHGVGRGREVAIAWGNNFIVQCFCWTLGDVPARRGPLVATSQRDSLVMFVVSWQKKKSKILLTCYST